MKIAISILALCCAFSLVVAAAPIDGKWVIESQAGGKKADAAKKAPSSMTLDLKAEGDKLTGTAAVAGGRRGRTVSIEDGKIEGNRFSFAITQKSKKGEMKVRWEGTVEGDQLRGTQTPEKARRGRPFTGKRQG